METATEKQLEYLNTLIERERMSGDETERNWYNSQFASWGYRTHGDEFADMDAAQKDRAWAEFCNRVNNRLGAIATTLNDLSKPDASALIDQLKRTDKLALAMGAP